MLYYLPKILFLPEKTALIRRVGRLKHSHGCFRANIANLLHNFLLDSDAPMHIKGLIPIIADKRIIAYQQFGRDNTN